jgi:hypothetical protein
MGPLIHPSLDQSATLAPFSFYSMSVLQISIVLKVKLELGILDPR